MKKLKKFIKEEKRIDSSHMDSYWSLAKICKKNKEYDKALSYYKIVLNLTLPTHQLYDVILEMGDIYRDTQQKEKAVRCYKKAIKINNKRDEKTRNYYLYLKCGHLSSSRKMSIKNFKEAIKVRPDRYEAYSALGVRYLHKNDNKVIELLKKSLKENPRNAQAQVNMGVAYGNLDKDKKALKCYKRALLLDSNLFQSYINLFSLYEEKHKYPPKKIERMFIEKFKKKRDIYVMYVIISYLVDIYYGKEIDLTVFEKEYKNAGMKCCRFKAKNILKDTRKKDKKRVSELLEVLKKHTKLIKD